MSVLQRCPSYRGVRYERVDCIWSFWKHSFKQRKAIGDIPVFIRTPKGDRNLNPQNFVGTLFKMKSEGFIFCLAPLQNLSEGYKFCRLLRRRYLNPPYSKQPSLGRVQIKNGTSPVALYSSVTITGGDLEKSCCT